MTDINNNKIIQSNMVSISIPKRKKTMKTSIDKTNVSRKDNFRNINNIDAYTRACLIFAV